MLVRILPSIWVAPTGTERLEVLAQALAAAYPDAVITGRAAARLTWWPELSAHVLTAARPLRPPPAPRFSFGERRVDPNHVIEYGGLRITDVAMTVLDLIPELGGAAIDEALRRRVVTLEELWTALAATPGRRGNRRRRALLHDSRDQPWSEAERALHQVLRPLRLPCRWYSNFRVPFDAEERSSVTSGVYYLDAGLPDLLLDIEVDGHEFHATKAAFNADRLRDTRLAAQGWQVVRLAAVHLLTEPEKVRARIESIVRHRLALFRDAHRPPVPSVMRR